MQTLDPTTNLPMDLGLSKNKSITTNSDIILNDEPEIFIPNLQGVNKSKYNINLSEQDFLDPNHLNKTRALNQPWHHQMGRSIAQMTVNEFALGTLEGISNLLFSNSITNSLNILQDTEKGFGNIVSNYFGDLKKDFRDYTQIYEKNPGEFAPLNDFGGWFFNGMVSVASTLGLMIPSGLAVKALAMTGRMGKLGKIANDLNKSMLASVGLSEASGAAVAQAFFSRHMENMLESTGTFEELKEKYQREGLDEAQAIEYAKAGAMATYYTNWVMVLPDIAQYSLLSKAFKTTKAGGLVSGEVSGSRLQNAFKGIYKAESKGFAALQSAISEGLEEGYQHFAGKYGEFVGDRAAGKDVYWNLADEVFEGLKSDHELWNSMFFGAIGGGLMTTAGQYINPAQKEIMGAFSKSYRQQLNAEKEIKKELLANKFQSLGNASKMLSEIDALGNKEASKNVRKKLSIQILKERAEVAGLEGVAAHINSVNSEFAEPVTENTLFETDYIYNTRNITKQDFEALTQEEKQQILEEATKDKQTFGQELIQQAEKFNEIISEFQEKYQVSSNNQNIIEAGFAALTLNISEKQAKENKAEAQELRKQVKDVLGDVETEISGVLNTLYQKEKTEGKIQIVNNQLENLKKGKNNEDDIQNLEKYKEELEIQLKLAEQSFKQAEDKLNKAEKISPNELQELTPEEILEFQNKAEKLFNERSKLNDIINNNKNLSEALSREAYAEVADRTNAFTRERISELLSPQKLNEAELNAFINKISKIFDVDTLIEVVQEELGEEAAQETQEIYNKVESKLTATEEDFGIEETEQTEQDKEDDKTVIPVTSLFDTETNQSEDVVEDTFTLDEKVKVFEPIENEYATITLGKGKRLPYLVTLKKKNKDGRVIRHPFATLEQAKTKFEQITKEAKGIKPENVKTAIKEQSEKIVINQVQEELEEDLEDITNEQVFEEVKSQKTEKIISANEHTDSEIFEFDDLIQTQETNLEVSSATENFGFALSNSTNTFYTAETVQWVLSPENKEGVEVEFVTIDNDYARKELKRLQKGTDEYYANYPIAIRVKKKKETDPDIELYLPTLSRDKLTDKNLAKRKQLVEALEKKSSIPSVVNFVSKSELSRTKSIAEAQNNILMVFGENYQDYLGYTNAEGKIFNLDRQRMAGNTVVSPTSSKLQKGTLVAMVKNNQGNEMVIPLSIEKFNLKQVDILTDLYFDLFTREFGQELKLTDEQITALEATFGTTVLDAMGTKDVFNLLQTLVYSDSFSGIDDNKNFKHNAFIYVENKKDNTNFRFIKVGSNPDNAKKPMYSLHFEGNEIKDGLGQVITEEQFKNIVRQGLSNKRMQVLIDKMKDKTYADFMFDNKYIATNIGKTTFYTSNGQVKSIFNGLEYKRDDESKKNKQSTGVTVFVKFPFEKEIKAPDVESQTVSKNNTPVTSSNVTFAQDSQNRKEMDTHISLKPKQRLKLDEILEELGKSFKIVDARKVNKQKLIDIIGQENFNKLQEIC